MVQELQSHLAEALAKSIKEKWIAEGHIPSIKQLHVAIANWMVEENVRFSPAPKAIHNEDIFAHYEKKAMEFVENCPF